MHYTASTMVLGLLFMAHASSNQSVLKEKYVLYRSEAGCNIDVCYNATLNAKEEIANTTFNRRREQKIGISCCNECYCNEDCARRGDCCPDHESSSVTGGIIPTGGLYRCVPNNLRSNKYSNYRMITRCLNDFPDEEVKNKCTFDPTSGLEYYLPVSSNVTGESYRNRFCAECNFEDKATLTTWTARLICVNDSIRHVTFSTILQDIQATAGCNLFLYQPNGVYIDECADIYDSCNQTGLWSEFDQDIIDGCASFREQFHGKYRNIFCYACNTDWDLMSHVECVMSENNEFIPTASLSILFDFNSPDGVVKPDTMVDWCPSETVYNSYLDTCHVINCDEGYFFHDGDCNPMIWGLCMDAYLLLRPKTDTPDLDTEDIRKAIEKAVDKLLSLSVRSAWDVHTLFSNDNETLFVLHVRFKYDIKLGRNLTELPKKDFVVHFETYPDAKEIVFDVTLQDSIGMTLLSGSKHGFGIPGVGGVDVTQFNGESPCNQSEMQKQKVLSRFTACAWIELALEDFNVLVIKEELHFVDMNMILTKKKLESLGSDSSTIDASTGSVRVCVHDFLPDALQSKNLTVATSSPLSGISGYLTLITSIVSIGASIFVVVTYVLFKALRKQPGVNNMMLSIHMLLGRSLFIFAIRQETTSVLCYLVGVGVHFLELSTIFWYLICSFHMFRTFRITAPMRDRSVCKTTLKYALVVTLMSISFVLVNVVSSLIVSGDAGYGNSVTGTCWISRRLFIAYTISIPALVTVLCNIAMFLVAIYRIGHALQPNLTSTNHQRQTFVIYVKLSVLTGLTWLMIIPYVFSRIEVFNYFFICLYGSNGVCVMVAFMMTKKVCLLYKSLFSCKTKNGEVRGRSTATTQT